MEFFDEPYEVRHKFFRNKINPFGILVLNKKSQQNLPAFLQYF